MWDFFNKYNTSQQFNFWVDTLFFFIFIVLSLAYLPFLVYLFRQPNSRTLYNVLMFSVIYLVYLLRIATFMYSIFWDDNRPFLPNTMIYFFAFQLPFDLLHIGTIAHYF